VLDLVKQSEKREREVRVGNEFRHSIDYVNSSIDKPHKIRYCALDYSHISKHRNLDVSYALNEVATWAVNQTGFFCSSPSWKIKEGGVVVPFTADDECEPAKSHIEPVFPMEQSGVLRTNCIEYVLRHSRCARFTPLALQCISFSSVAWTERMSLSLALESKQLGIS
jgi:phosphatidylinositol 3,5-bisphosphate 5-phosphatase